MSSAMNGSAAEGLGDWRLADPTGFEVQLRGLHEQLLHFRTMATGPELDPTEGWPPERFADAELRHVDAARHGQRIVPGKARIDFQQRRLAALGSLT